MDLIDLSSPRVNRMNPFEETPVEDGSLSQYNFGEFPHVNYQRGATYSLGTSSSGVPTGQTTLVDRVNQLETLLFQLQHLPDHLRSPHPSHGGKERYPYDTMSAPSFARAPPRYPPQPTWTSTPVISGGFRDKPVQPQPVDPTFDFLSDVLTPQPSDATARPIEDPWTQDSPLTLGVQHGTTPTKLPREVVVDDKSNQA